MVRIPLRPEIIAALVTLAVAAVVFGVLLPNKMVESLTAEQIHADINAIPKNRVGLLLGTSKYSRTGGDNDYYALRIQAAHQLFTNNKIDYILISGDNSSPYYNEPSTMRRDLLKMGIPRERIYRDYAGLRTLDSIVRAKEVFGLERFTIISQADHNARALYVAQSLDLDAIAFNASDSKSGDFSNRFRETLARVLAVIEINWLGTEPRHLGPRVEIGRSPPT